MLVVAALGYGLVVRARPALLAPGLAPGLASAPTPGRAPVPTPGLGIGPPLPPALVRSGAAAATRGSARPLPVRSRLRLSASSEPPEPIALPAYPVNIYIEDTDAFAVTYYANYVRFFERAAYAWLGAKACGDLMRAQGHLLGVEALDGLKYADAALLLS